MTTEHAAPRAIVLHAASGVLELDWGNDVEGDAATPHVQRVATAHLRAQCPCSACEKRRINEQQPGGQPSGQPLPMTPDASTVTAVELMGAYALHIRFADGHDRGIYPWSYLRALGSDR